LRGGEIAVGIALVVDGDGGAEDALAVGRDAVKPSPRDLGDESVTAQLDDETRDALASSTRFVRIGWWSRVEAGGDVVVAEPADGVLAGQHGAEQREVGGSDVVEAGVGPPVRGSGPGQGVHR